MAKPKNTTNRTYLCKGRLHRNTNAHEVLKDRRIAADVLYDAAIDELADKHPGKTLAGNQAQLLATAVGRALGIQRGPLDQRCRIATVGKAVKAWNNHVNHGQGLPRKYDGKPVRTIETYANGQRLQKPLVTVNESGNATLRFPGLPPVRFYSYQPLPDDQPTYASVSVRGRQVQVSLVYRIPQVPLPPGGQWDPCAVLGLDLGITELIATSAGISHEGISQKTLDQRIKKAAQLKQAMVRKAVRAGFADFRALLDENNRQVLTENEKPRRYLHWISGKPTKQYRKAAKCLSSLLKQRSRQRKAYRHQVAAEIVRHCAGNSIQLIALEDLKISNMTSSGKGTPEKPRKGRAQKRSLNRRILEQGWAELAALIRYKARKLGIRVVEVNAGGTSQTCSLCGVKDKKSRKKKLFQCVNCHFKADADHNAAVNIGDRGTHIFMQRKVTTMDEVRQHRLDRANGMNPRSQEPGTGIDEVPQALPTGYPASNQPRTQTAGSKNANFNFAIV